MTFRPVVSSTALSENEVVRSKDLSEGTRPHRVHGTGLQVNQNRPGDVLPSGGLVVVDVDPLELKVRVSVVVASRVDAMFVRNNFPELGADLVATLAGLKVNNLTHLVGMYLLKITVQNTVCFLACFGCEEWLLKRSVSRLCLYSCYVSGLPLRCKL